MPWHKSLKISQGGIYQYKVTKRVLANVSGGCFEQFLPGPHQPREVLAETAQLSRRVALNSRHEIVQRAEGRLEQFVAGRTVLVRRLRVRVAEDMLAESALFRRQSGAVVERFDQRVQPRPTPERGGTLVHFSACREHFMMDTLGGFSGCR